MVDPKWMKMAEEKCREQGIPLAVTEDWQLAELRQHLRPGAKRAAASANP